MRTKTLGIVFLAWMQILLFFTIIKSLQVVVATNVFLPSKLKRTFFLGQPLASGGCYFRNARAWGCYPNVKFNAFLLFKFGFLEGIPIIKKKIKWVKCYMSILLFKMPTCRFWWISHPPLTLLQIRECFMNH